MIAEQIGAIAPGWFIVALLLILAVAIGWAFLEGNEEEDQIEQILAPLDTEVEQDVEPQTVQVIRPPYDWEIEEEGGVR